MSSKALSRVANILFMLFSLALILLLTYFFGHKLLSGGLVGNDSPNAFGFIVWLDKYFPKIPLWYPLQGTGVSFVQGYQVFPLLVVIWLHRLTSLSLIQAFELISFLSIFLSALGLYFLGWLRFKSQTVGLIAAIFFLLAPISWVWTMQAGFFASAFSMIFFAPALLFIDWYFDFVLEGKITRGRKLAFLASVFFVSLSLLSHFTTFMALLIISVLYFSLYAIIRDRRVIKNIVKAAWAGILVFGTSLLVSAFWFISFYSYNSLANWDGSNNPNPSLFPPVNLKAFLSIPTKIFEVGSVWTFSVPIYIWILALFAILAGVFYSRRIVILALVVALSLYASIFTKFYVLVSNNLPFLASAFSPRVFWVAYNFLGPLLASFCILYAFRLFFSKLQFGLATKSEFSVATSLLALASALFLVVFVRSVDREGASSFAHYGPIYTYPHLYRSFAAGDIYGAGLDLRDIWGRRIIEDLTYVVLTESASNPEDLILKSEDENLKKFSRIAYLKEGGSLYLDRDYKIGKIPEDLKGLLWLTTSNDFKNFSEEEFLSFKLGRTSKVYIAYDSRARNIPNWLKRNFRQTGQTIEVIVGGNMVVEMKIYEKDYPVGWVGLGGNRATPASGACFSVKVPTPEAKTGYVDTCCYYQVEKEISDLCEAAGAKVTLGDFLEQLKFKNWPLPGLANKNPLSFDEGLANLFSRLPKKDNLRIDISPNSYGGLLARLGALRQDISLLNVYTFQLSLNHVFWANSQGIFYSENKGKILYQEPDVLNQEAKYFGVNYILLGGKDPKDKYLKAGWQMDDLGGGSVLAKAPFDSSLFELSDKPSVLVLGQQKFRAYESFYNTSIEGALPIDKAYVVMGEDFVDDYDLPTLKEFDVLVLHAYNYHSSQKAWDLLERYVKEGGSLFVDTGWQYTVPDWQLVKTPNFIPLEELEWKSLSMQGPFSVPDEDFRKGFGVESFSPLIWKEKPWGVSTSKKVKSWASVVLSYDDYPLVVKGKLGEGKVVWSGMNIISHAHDAKNKKEVEFIGKIFDYLLSGREKAGVAAEMKREWPDKVEIELTQDLPSGGNLFFREAYTPNWKGHINFGKDNERFEVYRGGPGLIYARLPALKKGNKIILEYKMLPSQMVGYPVSFVTFLFILAFIGDGILNKGELFGKINSSLKRILNFPINRMKRAWERDEER